MPQSACASVCASTQQNIEDGGGQDLHPSGRCPARPALILWARPSPQRGGAASQLSRWVAQLRNTSFRFLLLSTHHNYLHVKSICLFFSSLSMATYDHCCCGRSFVLASCPTVQRKYWKRPTTVWSRRTRHLWSWCHSCGWLRARSAAFTYGIRTRETYRSRWEIPRYILCVDKYYRPVSISNGTTRQQRLCLLLCPSMGGL